MSHDEVDNLQSAEDHIGCLEVWITDAIDMLRTLQPLDAADVQRVIDKLTFHPYCRLDCANGECSDDCGCQAHGDGPHPGWLPRRTLETLSEEFDCIEYTAPALDDEWALIENNVTTGEHWVTTHVDLDSADKYAKGQEPSWLPVVLVHLISGERLVATVERSMSIQWTTNADDTEPVTS